MLRNDAGMALEVPSPGSQRLQMLSKLCRLYSERVDLEDLKFGILRWDMLSLALALTVGGSRASVWSERGIAVLFVCLEGVVGTTTTPQLLSGSLNNSFMAFAAGGSRWLPAELHVRRTTPGGSSLRFSDSVPFEILGGSFFKKGALPVRPKRPSPAKIALLYGRQPLSASD